MATATTIKLSTGQKPSFYSPKINDAAAERVSELLQENHEKHHIFVNQRRFHNHIVHHLLTIYSLGATPDALTLAYDRNANYQRPVVALKKEVVQEMRNPETYLKCMGSEKYYGDFLSFYASELEKNGLQSTLDTYLFDNSDLANQLFGRLFAGLLHPLIHLGFGLEFDQPAIVAEALAQAAVHENWISPLFIAAEEAAKEYNGPERTLLEIMDQMKVDKSIQDVVLWEDDNKTRDGIMKRGLEKTAKIIGQWKVKEDQLEEKTAEMISTVLFYAAASQNPSKAIKFDFLNIHHTNSSIFFPKFLSHPAVNTACKIRLLEWKGRFDLINYLGRNTPTLRPEDITNYRPKFPNTSWPQIFERSTLYDDDGHVSKLVRATALGEKICKPYEGKKGFVIEGDMWEKMAHMAIDAIDTGSIHWVRNCGWEQAWRDVPERQSGKL